MGEGVGVDEVEECARPVACVLRPLCVWRANVEVRVLSLFDVG